MNVEVPNDAAFVVGQTVLVRALSMEATVTAIEWRVRFEGEGAIRLLGPEYELRREDGTKLSRYERELQALEVPERWR